MPLDDKTEIMAHFIGAFEMTTEATRMRSDYDKFRAEAKKADGPGDLLNVKIQVTSPLANGEYNDKLNVPEFTKSTASKASTFPHSGAVPHGINFQTVPLGTLPNLPLSGLLTPLGGVTGFRMTLEPPASVATINLQQNRLDDSDIFQNIDLGISFNDITIYQDALADLVVTADALQVASIPGFPANEAAISQDAIVLVKTLADAETPDIDGATMHMFHGATAYGGIENGVQVETASAYTDALPAARIKVNEGQEADAADDDEETHDLNTGMNTLINQTSISSFWLDAPVIVVMGDYVSFNAISQVNVYNDFDTTSLATENVFGDTTHAINSAAITAVANAVVETGYSGGPAHVLVTRIEGNVINFNHVQQFNFAYDNDVVSVTFTASETYLQLSDNTLINLTSLNELGYQYDLIFIGGNMIDLRAIQQTNVLLDADSFYSQDAYGGTFSGSDNLLWNQASIYQSGFNTLTEMPEHFSQTADTLGNGSDNLSGGVLNDTALDGTEVLRVLYISGDHLDVQLVEQVNVLGDADQIAIASETIQSANGANISVVAGSNALMNFASIDDYGVDSTVYVGGEGYSDAMLYQAEFISTDDPLVVRDTSELASEAVLFLADDMIEGTTHGTETDLAPVISGEPEADVMQSMLA